MCVCVLEGGCGYTVVWEKDGRLALNRGTAVGSLKGSEVGTGSRNCCVFLKYFCPGTQSISQTPVSVPVTGIGVDRIQVWEFLFQRD